MKKNLFFANAAKAAFALAAVFMMSIALASCGGDDKDDPNPGPSPKPNPNPELRENALTLNGKDYAIAKASIIDIGQDNYFRIELATPLVVKIGVYMRLDLKLHATGKPFELTKLYPEKDDDDPDYRPYGTWELEVYQDGKTIFACDDQPDKGTPCISGTVTITGNAKEDFAIEFKNVRAKGKDGKEYTFSAYFKGKPEKKTV